jgi:NADPH-dependent curcumin reductase CurA
MSDTMRQVVLKAYAQGNPKPEDFAIEKVPVPVAGPGEILLQTLWLALDPLIRFAIDEVLVSGVNKVRLGEVMYGPTV